jgi:hypothetical protein
MEPTALKGTFLNFSGSSPRRPLAIRPSVISNLQFRRHVNNVALKSSYTVRASAFTPNPEPKGKKEKEKRDIYCSCKC